MSRHPQCMIQIVLPPLKVGDQVYRGPLCGLEPYGLDVITRVRVQHYDTASGRRFRRSDGTAADNESVRIWPMAWDHRAVVERQTRGTPLPGVDGSSATVLDRLCRFDSCQPDSDVNIRRHT